MRALIVGYTILKDVFGVRMKTKTKTKIRNDCVSSITESGNKNFFNCTHNDSERGKLAKHRISKNLICFENVYDRFLISLVR